MTNCMVLSNHLFALFAPLPNPCNICAASDTSSRSCMRQVPLRQIHLFTAIQLAGLVVLWAVKVSPLALIFPLFIVMLVPLRIVLDRFFEERILESLDSDVEEEEPSGEAAG